METLESSRVCRLCGKQSGISINIFDKNESHVRKINAVLPIMVHEMDLLPKHMCHRCSYKLEEFHKFYVDCLKTDTALKSQLSWMQKDRTKEKIGVPMVHIENVNIKTEPLDYDVYELEPIVENIDYINSMANSVAFPAGGIHDGLMYAAFPRYQCCCDKKDQSRRKTTAKLRRNYKESMSKCGDATGDSRRILAHAKLRSARGTFARAVLRNHPKDYSPRVSIAEDARVRLLTTETKEVSCLNTRNRSYDRLITAIENQAATKNAIERNLRPRKTSLNYVPKGKRTPICEEPSAKSESYVSDDPTGTPSNFSLTRQIKVEQIDELKRRNLRPRINIVDYCGSKTKKGREASITHNAKKCKMERSSKVDDTSNDPKIKIKQETLNNSNMLGAITSATSVLPKDHEKVDVLTNNVVVTSDYLKLSQSQLKNKCQLAKRKPIVTNIIDNRLAKSKKMKHFPTENYSPKCLRSQDAYLRNGKARKYMEWALKKLQTGRKLINTVAKRPKKVPAKVLKIAENIKHYCETCNVSFMNMELFRLHACYYD